VSTYHGDDGELRVFRGSFCQGHKDEGVEEYSDGTKYKGKWVNDKKHGDFEVTDKDGNAQVCKFDNGKAVA
jgi:hypothetical protein